MPPRVPACLRRDLALLFTLDGLIRALVVIILRPRLTLRLSKSAPSARGYHRLSLANSPTARQRPDRGGWYESIISTPFIAERQSASQNTLNWPSNRGANQVLRQGAVELRGL